MINSERYINQNPVSVYKMREEIKKMLNLSKKKEVKRIEKEEDFETKYEDIMDLLSYSEKKKIELLNRINI